MSDTAYFKVTDGPVKIRTRPGGLAVPIELKNGQIIQVDPDSRTESGGFVWWEHESGWSAQGNLSKTRLFMMPITEEQAQAALEAKKDGPKFFFVADGPVKVRRSPGGADIHKDLADDLYIEVDPASRTEHGGYVWWRHNSGWSAQGTVSGVVNFMVEVDADDVPDDTIMLGKSKSGDLLEFKPPERVTLPELSGKVFFQVANTVKVRNQPSTDPGGWVIRSIKRGEVLECDMDSLIEADGYFWLKHAMGWSAWQDVYGQTVFLGLPGTIKGLVAIGPDGPDVTQIEGYNSVITRQPVDIEDLQWFQYFGNNVFGYVNGKSYGYDNYSQGLHGGLDYGNSFRAGVNIYAGINGTFVKADYARARNWKVYLKAGDLTFIYQHITGIRNFTPGQPITPDTVLAQIEHNSVGGWDHLHFEIRFLDKWIVNPLLFMTDDIRDELLMYFNPEKPNTSWPKTGSEYNFFFKTADWTKWTNPLDQPVLKLAGSLIGPRAPVSK
ncbi:MAG: M23 family metallopeptidase [Aggregatilineales bacterium]